MTAAYRTLVRGKLRQLTGLCVGGSANDPGGADLQCARDGKGRLTIPGSGQAGALIETAGRIFPDLFKGTDEELSGADWSRITMKREGKPSTMKREGKPERKGDDRDAGLRQSLWQFSPSHLIDVPTEMRQGVGIRQKTGATASVAKALFDVETIPAGAEWSFFFEVDSLRGKGKIEAVALFALWEWTCGHCWLGANAARGLGNMKLVDFEVLRLPTTVEAIELWPNVTKNRDELWGSLKNLKEIEILAEPEKLRQKAEILWEEPLPAGRFWYAAIDATFEAGPSDGGYGWDTLSVGGHASGMLAPAKDELVTPVGVKADEFLAGYAPDAPVITTTRGDQKRPFVPGSGVRGPLRHAASRLQNSRGITTIDPNTNEARTAKRTDDVSTLFGLAQHSGHLLVGDANLDGGKFKLVCLQHHAEDEFAAGVYGSGKFDRTAVLEGKFGVRLVIEAATKDKMLEHLRTMRSALMLAELGFVPLGGGKWRGHGWLKWKFEHVRVGQAGSQLEEMVGDTIATKLAAAEIQIGGGM